jgi:hypothetical protein
MSNRLSEGLARACSVAAFEKNVRREYHAGKTAKGTQHVAIAMSVLKRACGVKSKERMTTKEIVAAGDRKNEGKEGSSPFRVERDPGAPPIHRNAESGKEQPFLDPEDFTLSASGTVKEPKSKKKQKSKREEAYPSLMSWLRDGG